MAGLCVDRDKCVACGICTKSCGAGALEIRGGLLAVDENKCILCGICVDSCPFSALRIENEQSAAGDISQYKGIWVFCETGKGGIASVAYELLTKGRELADAKGCTLSAILAGKPGVKEYADSLFSYGADEVLLCESEIFFSAVDAPYANLISALINEKKPEILLFGATMFGRSLAPRVAARVGTGLTADCTVLEIDPEGGLLRQTRPAFGGNLMAAIITPNHRPQMATVRSGVMPAKELDAKGTGILINIAPPKQAEGIEILEQIAADSGETIAHAEIIISVGRGIGSQKNLAFVYELAELLNAKVGVSRPLVDMGWCEYKYQIGQTGCTVAPKILIAFGISGAIQHLAGIGAAETIIAVNNDPNAPIFSDAHYKCVGNCVDILKEMIAKMRNSELKG